MKEKFITTNNIQLCTESFGFSSDPAILLIAGATVSMLFWDQEFCTQLANSGFFVIRYDNRDVGKSTNYEIGTTPYDIVELTNDAIAILDAYSIKSAHLFGISLGGLIAQIASLKYPERVSSLILLSTGPWGDSDITIPEMDYRILEFHGKASNINWNDEESVVLYMCEGFALMSGNKLFNQKKIEEYIRSEYKRANNYLSMFNHAALGGGEEYYNRLNEINKQTLIIHGTEDKIWHFNHTNVLKVQIEYSELLVLDGTGHELHTDDWTIIINSVVKHCFLIKNY